jgi:hypothetical protein
MTGRRPQFLDVAKERLGFCGRSLLIAPPLFQRLSRRYKRGAPKSFLRVPKLGA